MGVLASLKAWWGSTAPINEFEGYDGHEPLTVQQQEVLRRKRKSLLDWVRTTFSFLPASDCEKIVRRVERAARPLGGWTAQDAEDASDWWVGAIRQGLSGAVFSKGRASYILVFDASAVEDVQQVLRHVCRSYGIEDSFESGDLDSTTQPVQILERFQHWLQLRRFELVCFDSGMDEWCGFIVPKEQTDKVIMQWRGECDARISRRISEL